MNINQRLWAGPHRIHWTPSQIHRICRHFGVDPRKVVERRAMAAAHAFDASVVKANADSGSRAFNVTISSGSVDRQGDTINVHGWKLGNYLRNPVVLWQNGHEGAMPIGKATNVYREGNRLRASMKFASTPMGDRVRGLVEDGTLRSTSVGFAPVKFEFSRDPARKGGIDFLEQELLEFSIVSVPANPDALIDSKTMSQTGWRARERQRQRRIRELDLIRLRGSP
jgi:HK97 family phage prohead protease